MAKTETISTRAQEVRVNRGYTQAEAARLMNVGAPTLAKIEDGTNGISRNMGPKMADAYAIALQELHAPIGSLISAPLRPLAEPPPPRLRIMKKSTQITGGDAPGSGKINQDASTRKLLRIWGRLPVELHGLAFRVLEGFIEPGQTSTNPRARKSA